MIEIRVTTDVRKDFLVMKIEPIFFNQFNSNKKITDQIEELMKNTKWHEIKIINEDLK